MSLTTELTSPCLSADPAWAIFTLFLLASRLFIDLVTAHDIIDRAVRHILGNFALSSLIIQVAVAFVFASLVGPFCGFIYNDHSFDLERIFNELTRTRINTVLNIQIMSELFAISHFCWHSLEWLSREILAKYIVIKQVGKTSLQPLLLALTP